MKDTKVFDKKELKKLIDDNIVIGFFADAEKKRITINLQIPKEEKESLGVI